MAEDESWLYGGHNGSDSFVVKSEKPISTSNHVIEVNLVNENDDEEELPPGVDPDGGSQTSNLNAEDEEKAPDDDEESDEDSLDDEEDNINVVIDELQATPAALQLKKATNNQTGKFTAEDLEAAGAINNTPVADFNIESLEDKPWRQPGADISDYFNYGFDEDSWRAYGERQRRMRQNESKSGHLYLNPDKILGGLPVNDQNKMQRSGMANGNANVHQRFHNATPMQQMRPNFPMPNQIQIMGDNRVDYSKKMGMNVMPPPVLLPNSNYPLQNQTSQPVYLGPHGQLQHIRQPTYVQQMPAPDRGNYYQEMQPNQYYNNTFAAPPIQNQWEDQQWKNSNTQNTTGCDNNIPIITINENDDMPPQSTFPIGLTQVKIEPDLPTSNISIKTEPTEEPKEVESRSRDSESRHKERSHRYRSRSRSRSYERKSRYRSRSRSPSSHHHKRRKTNKSDRNEDSD